MDAIFYRFYRDHFHMKKNWFSLVRNASFEYKGEMPLQPFDDINGLPGLLSMQYLDIGKKFPLKKLKNKAFTINTGVYWKRYDENLSGVTAEDDLSFFVRPNLIF